MIENITPSAPPTKFEIQRLYVKEQSGKIPQGWIVFNEEWKPEVHFEINVRHEKLSNTTYEVIIHINATAKNNNRTGLQIDVQQAGLFKIEGFTDAQIEHLLEAQCPNILFPYARKVVADISIEASFPPLILMPVSFDAVYIQRKKNEAEQVAGQKDEVLPN